MEGNFWFQNDEVRWLCNEFRISFFNAESTMQIAGPYLSGGHPLDMFPWSSFSIQPRAAT